MEPRVWQRFRPGKAPVWLSSLEPQTTGLLSHTDLKLWCAEDRAALGIRAGGVVYPVWLQPVDASLDPGARRILQKVGQSWCLMGPAEWVRRTEPLMPSSLIQRRVSYDFLVRKASKPRVPEGPGELRSATVLDADRLYPLQEAYEKEEVLFEAAEFHPIASRIHWALALRHHEIVALWDGGHPVAKAGTNALTRFWAQIGGVYTLPDRRGQGLQKRLMTYLLDRLFEQGRGVCLFVKKNNRPALALYHALDFQSRGEFLITYGRRTSETAFP